MMQHTAAGTVTLIPMEDFLGSSLESDPGAFTSENNSILDVK
jgi:hypothetical protein